MPVHTTWENSEQPIIRYTFTDPWTWDHFYAALEQGRQLREACGLPTINIIVDVSGSRHLCDGAMSHFGGLFRRGIAGETAIDSIVVFGANQFMLSVANVLTRVYPIVARQIRFVPSVDQAYAFLRQKDVTP
ncbi:MAG TPA: hypothetical protein VHO69_16505 [Phototrophicaceae bacterium]|nr:hypothetical protein [Phototrophicaceae bacterium]